MSPRLKVPTTRLFSTACLGWQVTTNKKVKIPYNCLVLMRGIHSHMKSVMPLQWRHNGRNGVWNHQPHDCLLNRLLRCRSKKTSKLRVTGLCEGNSPVTGGFPTQRASNGQNVSIWWRLHAESVSMSYCQHELTKPLDISYRWLSVTLQYIQCVTNGHSVV